MKKITKLFLAFTSCAFIFASCNNDDFDYDDYNERLEQEARRIDSTLKAQAPILEEYALTHFDEPTYSDSLGIWFEILQEPTDDSYEYIVTNDGYFIDPTATVKYKGELLDGTVFDDQTTPMEMVIRFGSQMANGVIPAWVYAFRPETITFGGTKHYTGLVPDGLKKGHKIRFVAPSPYCYDNNSSDKIPANSPLVFEIEVTEIRN